MLFRPFSDDADEISLLLGEREEINEELHLSKLPSSYFFYNKEEYIDLINATVNEIKDQQLGKIVMSRTAKFPFTDQPISLFKTLAKTYPEACAYLFHHPKAGTWMGATPELLVKGVDGKLSTMSLAGTREKGEENTFESKEELEQSLVTDYILQNLSSSKGLTNVKVKAKDKLKAGNLFHFVNKISADYSSDFDLENFFQTFHPTPAVGGFPKKEALDFIAKNEKHSRQYYCGYLGIKDKFEFSYFVNLRCMQLFKNEVVLYAGGGITADSNAEMEWEETNAKMRTLLNVLTSQTNE